MSKATEIPNSRLKGAKPSGFFILKNKTVSLDLINTDKSFGLLQSSNFLFPQNVMEENKLSVM